MRAVPELRRNGNQVPYPPIRDQGCKGVRSGWGGRIGGDRIETDQDSLPGY